jgi:hypothetical protein
MVRWMSLRTRRSGQAILGVQSERDTRLAHTQDVQTQNVRDIVASSSARAAPTCDRRIAIVWDADVFNTSYF